MQNDLDLRYLFILLTRTKIFLKSYISPLGKIKKKGIYVSKSNISISGLYTSPHHNDSLCEEQNFQERTWTTQGRIEVTEPTPYPIIGEYTGVIPDTDGFCAKLYSDCNNPEIMFYTIFDCYNRSEVFEGKLKFWVK